MGKFVLLIGINYRGTSSELKGCINDVHNMQKFLLEHSNFKKEEMTILTEDTTPPTAENIINSLRSTISKIQELNAKGESSELWFHYSGHGSHITDTDGDENDGQDETLVPLDYMNSGLITDDMIKSLFSTLPETAKCVCIFDCCHSGTIMDLKYRYTPEGVVLESKEQPLKCNVTMISGCRDVQTSADAWIESNWAGAMTASFLDSMEKNKYKCNYEQLLKGMREYLNANGYSQVPQLCSSDKDCKDFPLILMF